MTSSFGWQERAACRDVDPDLFLPPDDLGEGLAAATKSIALQFCAVCPVRKPCLDMAMSDAGTYGIWGGTTTTQRKAKRRKLTRKDRPRKPTFH